MFGDHKLESTLVRLTGDFSISQVDGISLKPKGKKPAALLAYLCFYGGREIPRDLLADLLWSDRGQKQAQDSLRQALFAIRAALADTAAVHLTSTRNTVQLSNLGLKYDLWSSDGTIDITRDENLLNDLERVSKVFDDWLYQKRREVRQDQIRAAERQLSLARELDPEKLLWASACLLRLDPTNEAAAREAMRVHAERGEQGHVKHIFDDIRTALRSDDLDVSDTTLGLFEDIRSKLSSTSFHKSELKGKHDNRTFNVPSLGIINRLEPHDSQAFVVQGQELLNRLIWRMTQMPDLRVRSHSDQSQNQDSEFFIRVDNITRNCRQRITLHLESADGHVLSSYNGDFDDTSDLAELDVTVDSAVTQFLPILEEHIYRLISGAPSTAYEHYIIARRHYLVAQDDEYIDRVMSHLHSAVELDPEFLPALEKLVMHYNTGSFMSFPGTDHRKPRAIAMSFAQRLLFLNSQYPNAHVRMAWCHLWQGNFISAERSLRKAKSLKPYDPHILNVMGTAFVYLGFLDEAEEFYAMSQQRLVHDMDFQRTDYGELHYLKGDFSTALSWIEAPEVRTPYRTYFWRVPTFAQLGMLPRARDDLDAMVADLKKRWRGPKPFTAEAGIQWMCDMKPYRRARDRDLLVDGFNKAGVKITSRSFPLIDR